jgi:hypothetical protein
MATIAMPDAARIRINFFMVSRFIGLADKLHLENPRAGCS